LTTGREIVEQLRGFGRDKIDAFVAGVGTGGTLMGVGVALRATMPELLLVAVEPAESDVMSGGQPGEHGIMGIGDGFVPDLLDLGEVDEILRVSTEEARAAAQGIRREHGFCVGLSSGANFAAARLLRQRGLSVATLWPDCSDRYGSVGLQSPSSEEVFCPLRRSCATRAQELLGSRPGTRIAN
jgi:cysteine synthase A